MSTHSTCRLARLARVSRDTIYADLKARSIDTSARAQDATSTEPAPRNQLEAESLRPLAQLVEAVSRSAFGRAPNDPLKRVITSAGNAARLGRRGLDRLEGQHALTVLSQVITRHLDGGAFVERRKDALPGGPLIRHRTTPSNED